MANDRHVVQRVVEAERKTHHQQRGADLDLVAPAGQVLRREGADRPPFRAAPRVRSRSRRRRFRRPCRCPGARGSCRRGTAESRSRWTSPCCPGRRAVRSRCGRESACSARRSSRAGWSPGTGARRARRKSRWRSSAAAARRKCRCARRSAGWVRSFGYKGFVVIDHIAAGSAGAGCRPGRKRLPAVVGWPQYRPIRDIRANRVYACPAPKAPPSLRASSGGTAIGMSSSICAMPLPSGSRRIDAMPPPSRASCRTKLHACRPGTR